MHRLGVAALAVLLVAGCSRLPAAAQAPDVAATSAGISQAVMSAPSGASEMSVAGPTLAQMIGQKLVVRMEGTTPSADLLGRIRRGEVGGVLLFGSNITTRTALIALTHTLRAAAVAGGQPHFLIAVDQEGGSVKRIPWAPPTLSPPQIGLTGSASIAHAQGAATGSALHGLGIDIDFAPVADVPATTASFMYREGRTWSFSAKSTAILADAFASGLESTGVDPTMKHFPGLGFATLNTDAYVVTIGMSTSRLAPGLRPYQTAISHHIPLIMLSNATYTAYDQVNAAGWSSAIGITLLRHTLGFTGVTITDSLDGTAHARGVPTGLLAYRAARAGTDMILTTGSEAASKVIYTILMRDTQGGFIPRAALLASYDRILALKKGL
jgi:beta-N-acetylhexosaminidase